jgi:membrane protein DedA with SNARE-associated domain
MTSTASVLDNITDWAIGLMESMGGPGAGLAIAMENLFPPIPSEVILPLAGLAAGQGRMSLFGAIAWTTAGSLVGAVALYYIGMVLGRDRIVAIATKLPLVKVADIEKTEAWFNKHGGRAVFFGRFIPIFRSFISIPAGLERMPLLKFLLYTAGGSLIWNTIFIMVGYKLGENYKVVTAWVDTYSKVIVVLVALAIVVFVVMRIRTLRRAKAAALQANGGADPIGTPIVPSAVDHTGAPAGPVAVLPADPVPSNNSMPADQYGQTQRLGQPVPGENGRGDHSGQDAARPGPAFPPPYGSPGNSGRPVDRLNTDGPESHGDGYYRSSHQRR